MSKIKSEVTFVERNGRTLSKRKEYYENGKLLREGLYSKGQGSWGWNIPVGSIVTFYENGKMKCEELFDEAGNLNGETKLYNSEGILEKTVIYLNGKEIKKAP